MERAESSDLALICGELAAVVGRVRWRFLQPKRKSLGPGIPARWPVQLYEGRHLAADEGRDVVAAIEQQDDGALAAGIDDGDGTAAERDPDLVDGFACGHDALPEAKSSGACRP